MIFRVCFIIVFSLLSVVRVYFRIRTGAIHDHVFTPREGALLVILRWILGLPLLVATGLYIFLPDTWSWMYLPVAVSLRVLGIVLGCSSVILLVQVHRALGRNFSSTLVIRQGHRLIRTGPYRFVRHPMYSAYLLLFVAAFLMSANWVVGTTGAAIIATLMTLRLAREEALLIERFGDEYEEYRRTTGMFLPMTHKLSLRTSKAEDLA